MKIFTFNRDIQEVFNVGYFKKTLLHPREVVVGNDIFVYSVSAQDGYDFSLTLDRLLYLY
jgi:citrate lyase beta subunit